MGQRHARIGLLLATTSVAALLVGAQSPASAACTIAVTGLSGPVTNTNLAPIDCIDISTATVNGNVTNPGTGTITPGSTPAGVGINVDNSTINGQILNAGTITVTGIGILVQSNSVVTNGIVNTNAITTSGTLANAIAVMNVSTFAGGISNSGTITTTGTTAHAILVNNVSTFAGGISNSGAITTTGTSASAIVVTTVSTFAGGISNSGIIQSGNAGIVVGTPCGCLSVSTFTGGINNSGTITASGPAIAVAGVETFTGGISNSGDLTGLNGIGVGNVSTFTGGITNGGNITARTGIFIQSVSTFAGGITNGGTINASRTGISINDVTAFSGNVVNIGTINAQTGILVCACSSTFAGSIVNTGTINATGAGIFVSVATFIGGITNAGTITTSSAGGFTPGGIIVTDTQVFAGNIVNSGTITVTTGFGIVVGGGLADVGNFTGGITNTGTITVLSVGTGIVLNGVSAFQGGVTNSGTISALVGISIGQSPFGLPGTGVSLFTGGILNSGTINGLAGIVVAQVSTFAGGITNTGTINAAVGILLGGGCGCGDVTTFAGGISNSGTIAATGTGIVINSNVSTFLGGITNTGTITAGSTGISLGIGGMSVFNSGTINVPGGVAIAFTGAGNTLTLGPGSNITGSVLGVPGDTFQLGGTGTDSFDVSNIGPTAQYQNFSIFNKIDSSTWTLTGTNTTALPWTVLQGTLNVAAGAALPLSPFTVQGGVLAVNGTVGNVTLNGGTLMGNGTLAALFANGGVVAPGNSIGQLNVNGPVTFAAGTTYQVEANAAGQSDKIVATGTATLSGGTVQAILAPGAYGPTTTYTILTANGGRSGGFSTVTSSLPFLIPTLTYDTNNAYLTLTRNPTFIQNQAGTPDQRAVASALDTFPTNNALFLAVADLTGGTTRQALSLLSGEIHASVHSVMLDDSLYLRQAVLGRLRQASYGTSFTQGPLAALGAGGPLAYAAPDETETAALAYAAKGGATGRNFPIKTPREVAAPPGPDRTWWAQGVGAWGKINGDGNAADVSRSLGGFFTGFDQRFGEWRVGAAGGYTNSSVSVSARASSANIELAHLAGYAGTSFGAWNVRGGAAVSFDQISTSRSIIFPGFSDSASARYHGTNGQVFGEAGYGMTFGPVAVEPFAGLAWVHIGSTSFTETGGLATLTGSGNKNDIGYSTLGARAATHVLLANGMLFTPRASLAWQHAFGDVTPGATLAFRTAGIPFNITGAPIARDSALVDAGFDLNVGWNATVGLSYVGVLANTAHDHSVKGNFSWKF